MSAFKSTYQVTPTKRETQKHHKERDSILSLDPARVNCKNLFTSSIKSRILHVYISAVWVLILTTTTTETTLAKGPKVTKNDGAASYRALHGPKPPRGYCTQISRAISPSSRCYEHLLVATGSINLGSNPDSAEEEQNDDTDRQAKWWHKNKAPILKGTPEAATMEAKEVGGNDKSKWARKEPLEGKRQAQDEELVYVRFETLGRNLNELSTSAINEKLVLSIFNQLLVPNPTFKIENNANDTEINEIRAQILSSSSTPTSTNSTVPNKCKSSMEKLLCRLIYPSCHFRRSDISALVRPPCREDCFLLKDVFCANLNWSKFGNVLSRLFNATLMSMINELDLENQGDLPAGRNESPHEAANEFNSSIHFYWPHEHSLRRCELLPPLRSIHFERFLSKRLLGADQKPNKMFSMGQVKSQVRAKWPICSNAHLTKAATSTRPTEASTFTTNSSSSSTNPQDCLKSPDGVDYMGIMNHTRSGQACQAWKSQRAHSHSSSEILFDNMKGASNFCRNPGGIEVKPYCYTRDGWEYCEIQACS